ncbi:MAG: dockerin type I repeat-containing protein, partial [Prevotella sp.]|nr:dockerin type I repeat-containing protein [Prevotellaceae bacterium]MDY5250587.1 dockerin type I repeat-containing protein [Prevotella sp.]
KIGVEDVYSMANKQILIDNIKLSSANGKDFSSANEATTILPDMAAAEATAFKTAHAEILGKTVDTVVSSDLPAIASALNDYGQLADAVKAKLVPEKNLLDALKAKAEELYIMGDVNNDGKITVTDVMLLVDYILELNTVPITDIVADVNGDGKVTVTDVQLLVDIILEKNISSAKIKMFQVREPE